MKASVAIILGGLFLISHPAVRAREAALHYKFSPATTNVYAVDITVLSEAATETCTGNVVLVTAAVDTNGVTLACSGNLKQSYQHAGQPGMGFYPGMMSQTMNVFPNDCKIELNERGVEIRNGGDYALAIPLGKLVQSLFEPLPPKAGNYETSDVASVRADPLWLGPADSFVEEGMNGQRFPMRFMGGYPRPEPVILTVARQVRFQSAALDASRVKLHKRMTLQSLSQTGTNPVLNATSESDLIFDRAAGLFASIETHGDLAAETKTVLHHAKVSFNARLLTVDEKAALFAPPPPPVPALPLSGAELDKITQDLKSADPDVRRTAMQRLSGVEVKSPSNDLLDAVAGRVGDSDTSTRNGVAPFLERYGTTNQLAALLKLATISDWTCSQPAIRALGKLHDQRAIVPLTEVIARGSSFNNDEQLATTALTGFGAVAEKAVLDLISERNVNTRRQACIILKEIGTSQSLPVLEKLVGDSDQNLNQSAAEAIQGIKQRQ